VDRDDFIKRGLINPLKYFYLGFKLMEMFKFKIDAAAKQISTVSFSATLSFEFDFISLLI
jgi:hypothetical protein